MEHLNGCLHVIISMWKFYTCFSRMFLLMWHRRQSSPLFSPCFCGDFYIFEIWCFSYLLGIFLIHFSSVWPLCRNQPIDLNYLLMAWFLNNCNAWLKWIKENLTGGLDITTVWKPYLVSEKCFFSYATCFHSVLMGCFLSYISKA